MLELKSGWRIAVANSKIRVEILGLAWGSQLGITTANTSLGMTWLERACQRPSTDSIFGNIKVSDKGGR